MKGFPGLVRSELVGTGVEVEVGESACLLFIYRSVCVVFTLSPCRLQAEECLPIEMLDKVSIDPHDDDVDVCAEID